MTATTYPSVPGYRDNESSLDAANAIAPQATMMQSAVLTALMGGGLTAFEIASATGFDFPNVQPRVSELLNKGLIRWSGAKRQSARSNVMVKVWELVAQEEQVAA